MVASQGLRQNVEEYKPTGIEVWTPQNDGSDREDASKAIVVA